MHPDPHGFCKSSQRQQLVRPRSDHYHKISSQGFTEECTGVGYVSMSFSWGCHITQVFWSSTHNLEYCWHQSPSIQHKSECFMPVGYQDGRNVVAWLSQTVAQALEAATQHTARQKAVRALSASIKERFRLADILVGVWSGRMYQASLRFGELI